jgi:hypothetical protein
MTIAIDPIPGDLDFADLVNKEARNDVSDAEAAWFRQSDIVESWRAQLVMLLNKVDAQLSHHKAERAAKRVELGAEEDRDLYLGYIAQAEKWRANALWFRKTLLDRLIEAKAIIAYNRASEFHFSDDDVDEVGRYEIPGTATA